MEIWEGVLVFVLFISVCLGDFKVFFASKEIMRFTDASAAVFGFSILDTSLEYFLPLPLSLFLASMESARIHVEQIQTNQFDYHANPQYSLQLSNISHFFISGEYQRWLVMNVVNKRTLIHLSFIAPQFNNVLLNLIQNRLAQIYSNQTIDIKEKIKIGAGAYANVFKIAFVQKPNGPQSMVSVFRAAFKEFNKVSTLDISLSTEKKGRIEDLEEICIHQSLVHPAIVKFYGAFLRESPTNYYVSGLIMEHAEGNSLADSFRLISFNPYFIGELLSLADAVNTIHSLGILHRDIKLPNILHFPLQGGRYKLKLSDFGIACKLSACLPVESVNDWRKGLTYPVEMFLEAKSMQKQTSAIDWYEFGTLISLLIDLLSQFPLSRQFLLPIVAALTVQKEPSKRIGYEQVKNYLTLIQNGIHINNSMVSFISRPIISDELHPKHMSGKILFHQNYSPEPKKFFLGFAVMPLGTCIVNQEKLIFIKPQVLVKVRKDFPLEIRGSFTMFQPRLFYQNQVFFIDSTFLQSICLCQCECYFSHVPQGPHCLRGVDSLEIVRRLNEIVLGRIPHFEILN